jgi:hypothetical protein
MNERSCHLRIEFKIKVAHGWFPLYAVTMDRVAETDDWMAIYKRKSALLQAHGRDLGRQDRDAKKCLRRMNAFVLGAHHPQVACHRLTICDFNAFRRQ